MLFEDLADFRYLSVCSGIEAATEAWHPFGMKCAGVAEIDAFPSQVLAHRLGAGRPRYMPDPDAEGLTEEERETRQKMIDTIERPDMVWGNRLTNFGDFTQIRSDDVGPVQLLVGGTPCQSFSIAGKRLGLDDPRGNLTLEFLALAKRIQSDWILWENVPGFLSHDEGRTMGAFTRLLGECGFRWAYRVLDAQYVRVDRFGRAVPQRRRRLFVVGYSGTAGIDPRAVLFDRGSLFGNPAPERRAGEGFAVDVAPSLVGSGRGTERVGESRGQDPVVAARMVSFGEYADDGTASAMKARDYKDATDLVAYGPEDALAFDAQASGKTGHAVGPVAGALHGGGKHGGRGAVVQPYTLAVRGRGDKRLLESRQDGTANAIVSSDGGRDGMGVGAVAAPIAFSSKDAAADTSENVSPTLRASSHKHGRANAGAPPAIAFAQNQRGEIRTSDAAFSLSGQGGKPGQGYPAVAHPEAISFQERGRPDGRTIEHLDEVAYALTAPDGGGRAQERNIATKWAVRRLTPRECERLQGFPDDFTMIPWKGKDAEDCPAGVRYRALGNSMAVNVMAFIGERIAQVELIARDQK